MADVGSRWVRVLPLLLRRFMHLIQRDQSGTQPFGNELSWICDGFKPSDELNVQTQVLDASGEVIHQGVLDRSEGVVDPRTRLTNP